MVKIRSINIENINDETTPERPVNQFVRLYGDHAKTDSHQNLSKNSNHIACNATHESDIINTHTKIEMTKTII